MYLYGEFKTKIMCKTIREKVLEQIDLVEELQSVAGINIVNCGNCGSVLLHRITPLAMDTPIEDYDITCPYCDFHSEPCDFPDFLYSGMENSAEFDEPENNIIKQCPVCTSPNTRKDFDFPDTMLCCDNCGADFTIDEEVIFNPTEI